MSVPETIIQDIAALKQSQADLRRSVDEGNRNMQAALDRLAGRMDGFADLLQTVARLTERQDAHSSGLDRAFNSIKQVQQHVDDIADEHQRWQTAHIAENAAVERRLSLWHGVAIGISLTAGVVLGILSWAGNSILQDMRGDILQERTTNRSDDARLDRLERLEAQYHGGSVPQ